jgi:RhoGEF domain
LRGESAKGPCKPILKKKYCRSVFSNVELLFNLNLRFYESLAREAIKSDAERMIGDCFLQVGQFLKMYSEYCSNQTSALRFVSLARGKKPPGPEDEGSFDLTEEQIKEFKSFCNYTQSRPESHNLDLPSFLIKPVQRVCKYPLLLREMIKNTPDTHPDYYSLRQAFDTICDTVHQIDEAKVRLIQNGTGNGTDSETARY